jgi:hypothetical protein
METFVIVDDDSIEITLSWSLITAEIQGKSLIVADIVIDNLAVKTPLSESSTYLIVQKIAEEPIVEFDLVYVTATGGVKVSDNNLGSNEAFVLGMALADTAIGIKVDVLILGVISDPIFAALALNTPIYLDTGGALTDDIPKKINGANYATPIGRALGSGSVLISVSPPLTLS